MNTQTSYFKKALVVLMAVIMVFTMMPSMAWADSNNATQSEIASVNIYVTVSLGTGEAARDFAKAKDGTDMAMPLRYNNDKQKKPLFSRGLSVCRLLFNSFSKLKIDENYKEKRRLFY